MKGILKKLANLMGLDISRRETVPMLLAKLQVKDKQIKVLGMRAKAFDATINPVEFNRLDSINKFYTILTEELYPERPQGCLDALLVHAVLTRHSRILDVGCGYGIIAGLIKDMFPTCQIEGCDFSPIVIDLAKAQHKGVEFFVHNIYEPFKWRYDVVICTEVLEHLERPEQALNNLLGAVDDKGFLFLTVPDGSKDKTATHINFWIPDAWKVFVEAASSETLSVKAGVMAHHKNPASQFNWAVLKKDKVNEIELANTEVQP